MHPEVHSKSAPAYQEPEVDSDLLLKVGAFGHALAAIGVPPSHAARGRFLKLDPKSIKAAVDGNPIGSQFIRHLIEALRPHEERLALEGLRVDIDSYVAVAQREKAAA